MRTRYDHILWDWNGTLLDDLDLCVDVVNRLLERRGIGPIDSVRYHEIFDFPVRSFYERLGFLLEGDTFAELSFEFTSAYDARRLEANLHVGVRDLLSLLQRGGQGQSILSAHRETTLRQIVSHFGIDHHFDEIAGLDDIAAHSKIERGMLLCDKLAIPRSSMLLVGDTLHDLEVAEALGIDCALLATGHHPKERLCADGRLVFGSLRELHEHLQGC